MNVVMSDHMSAWARALCVCALGPVEGEKMWKSLPATVVIAWWMSMLPQDEC